MTLPPEPLKTQQRGPSGLKRVRGADVNRTLRMSREQILRRGPWSELVKEDTHTFPCDLRLLSTGLHELCCAVRRHSCYSLRLSQSWPNVQMCSLSASSFFKYSLYPREVGSAVPSQVPAPTGKDSHFVRVSTHFCVLLQVIPTHLQSSFSGPLQTQGIIQSRCVSQLLMWS